jgi:two-component system phosphate regulon response regulator PhoB
MYRVLIAAHERILGNQLCISLSRSFFVDQVNTGWQAYELVQQSAYDAVVVQRDFPDVGGLHFCRQLRAGGSTAAIFIVGSGASANLAEMYESALAHGADHYLTIPISPRELSARLKAVIRRRQPNGYSQLLMCEGICLDMGSSRLSKADKTIHLRPMEVALLEFFLRNQNRLFSVDDLWREVWKRKGVPSDTVRAHVTMLRRKLRTLDADFLIKTVNGLGYKMCA